MKKKDLLQLPIAKLEDNLGLSGSTVEIKKFYDGEPYKVTTRNFIMRATVDEHTDLEGEHTLIVDLFKPNGTLVRRHFQNKACEYFSYIYENNKISNAGIDMWIPWYDSKVHVNKHSEQVIKNFLPCMDIDKNESVIALLRNSNVDAKNKKLKQKYQEKIDLIHAQMAEIKELPQEVYSWAKNTLMKKSRYIFYSSQPKKKETDGICSHCGKSVVIASPRAGKEGRCPSCKSRVIFKPKGRFLKSYGFTDRSSFVYFQPTKEGYCIRTFKASYGFYSKNISNFEKQIVSLFETQRQFYRLISGRFAFHKNFYYEQCLDLGGVMEWKEYANSYYSKQHVYPKGLNKLFKHKDFTAWHTDFELIAKKCGAIEYTSLANKANEQLLVGHFANMGLYRLTGTLIENTGTAHRGVIDTEQKSVKKALKCSKEELELYKRLNIYPAGVQLYKTLKEKHEVFDLKDFKYILDNTDAGHYGIPVLLQHMTLHKLVWYYKEFCFTYSLSNFLTDYKDYIENAVVLNLNLGMDSIKFPRHFKKAHDEAAEKYGEAMEGNFTLGVIAQMEQEYVESFYYADKKYLIRPPRDHAELITEGKVLKHCVARYAIDVAKRKTIILFIRKVEDPDKPFYTLELDPKTFTIQQNRGYRNNHNDTKEMAKEKEQVIKWAEEWQKSLMQRQHKNKTA